MSNESYYIILLNRPDEKDPQYTIFLKGVATILDEKNLEAVKEKLRNLPLNIGPFENLGQAKTFKRFVHTYGGSALYGVSNDRD